MIYSQLSLSINSAYGYAPLTVLGVPMCCAQTYGAALTAYREYQRNAQYAEYRDIARLHLGKCIIEI